ncbi:MAG: AbrB/MazE/SpoVT family DNA-binding domain-containing protein [Patescibacteria group bacterium]
MAVLNHTINTIPRESAPIARIGPKHQVTIPKEIFDKLCLDVGDYLDVQATGATIVMTPKKLIPKDQEWFYTKEWQVKEREADEAIARGKVSGLFTTADQLMAHLNCALAPRPNRKQKQR